jgi:hypothetical protein
MPLKQPVTFTAAKDRVVGNVRRRHEVSAAVSIYGCDGHCNLLG